MGEMLSWVEFQRKSHTVVTVIEATVVLRILPPLLAPRIDDIAIAVYAKEFDNPPTRDMLL